MFMKLGISIIAGLCLVGLAPLSASAQDELDDRTAARCVSLNRLSKTSVVDESNVLFYMRGGDIYLNRLPHRCAGLRPNKTFMYRTSMSQLCDLDVITVLERIGPGFMPGPSCGLGRFHPITKEEAKALNAAPPQRIEKKDPPTAQPEELGDSR